MNIKNNFKIEEKRQKRKEQQLQAQQQQQPPPTPGAPGPSLRPCAPPGMNANVPRPIGAVQPTLRSHSPGIGQLGLSGMTMQHNRMQFSQQAQQVQAQQVQAQQAQVRVSLA
jgi:E1A/CREB-binding protein